MIEKIILDFLTDALTVPVYAEKPPKPPETYILLEKTGGRTENHIRFATVTIQSYADTLYNAASMNEAIINIMDRITGLTSVSACKLNSNYNYTDTSEKKYRYQAVFDLVY